MDEAEDIERVSRLQSTNPNSRTRDLIHRWIKRRETSSPMKTKNSAAKYDSSAQLHIAVAISMPNPRGQQIEEVTVYELGLMTLTWDIDKVKLVLPSDENLTSGVDGVPANDG
jgi:hypothetical protein